MNSMMNETGLDLALQQLRRESSALGTPDTVRQKLMAEFAARQRKQRLRRFISQRLAPLMAMTATAAVAGWMVMTPAVHMHPGALAIQEDAIPLGASGPSAAYAAAADTPFIAVASIEQIEQEPTPRLVQAEVPRMLLASAGVPVDPEFAGDTVRAEMLVSASGETLAMRLMP